MKQIEYKHRLSLTLLFTGLVFLLLLVTMLIIGLAIFFLLRAGVLLPGRNMPDSGRYIVAIAMVSVFLGTILAATVGRYPLRPLNAIVNAMNRLAAGDFKTRLSFRGLLARTPVARELVDSFNRMAQQLENTELLRSDFINSFSHEFKTPIVSIAGFAKLLRKGKLTPEEQQEYLAIIEDESLRLSSIATNVLNLTRVENQTILTDVREYNLSEQLRSCILLLERKWSAKKLELVPDFGEHTIAANEELLKQVWLNLLDNAVKFTPDYGTVEVSAREDGSTLSVRVLNTGSEIPEEKKEFIFRKFYQADASRSSEGNGLGLAIVQRIVQLHQGTIAVESTPEYTAFTVTLPKAQTENGNE